MSSELPTALEAATYPSIVVSGSPRERGEQYGALAADRIRRSIDGYRDVFAHYVGIDWESVRERAAAYVAPIERYDARYLEELGGIAAGSGVELLDVVALNVRTELINGARVRAASAGRAPAECTSLGVRRADGTTLVGQNWDYYAHCRDTTVVLFATQDDGPNCVTVVEAGLLAKAGMNAAGIALVTNGIATADDDGTPGVPYHVLLRAVLDAESVADARDALARAERRAASGNFMIASADGELIDVEAWAGADAPAPELPLTADGLLAHANHCVVVPGDRADAPFELTETSVPRQARIVEVARERGGEVTVEDLQRAFADHDRHPLGICTHEDPSLPALERAPTCASLVMEPAARRILLADGNPCRVPYRELDTAILVA
ncbi:MAG TPA: C45 family peptidase [Conexibacter sp.]|jgi:isopenicillin-N N-acyltransferase-like protein|nr:C45 family peptidase [Conexibacter sp.]